MEREARRVFDVRQIANKRAARQANVAIAEGRIHTSKGEIYYSGGTGRKKMKKTL